MKHDLGLVHVNCKIGAGIENGLSKFLVDLHGIKGIFLVQSSGVHLEGRFSLRIFLLHEIGRRLPQLLDGNNRSFHDRADTGDAEHAAERLGNFAVVILRQTFHENSSVGPVHGKVSLAGLKCVLDLAHQRLLKDVAVLALDADLRVFDQKGLVSHSLVTSLSLSVWYIFSKKE